MRSDEAGLVSELIVAAFDEFVAADFDDWGKASFGKFASPEALIVRQLHGYVTLVAEADGRLQGMIQIRPPAHIVALFVPREYQRRGIARALITDAIRRVRTHYPQPEFVTVVSSPYAVPVYRRLGFEIVHPPQEVGRAGGTSLRLPLTHAADPEH